MKKGVSRYIILIILGLIVIVCAIVLFVLRGANADKVEVPEVEEVEQIEEDEPEEEVENEVKEEVVEKPKDEKEDEDDPKPVADNPLIGYVYGRELTDLHDVKDGIIPVRFKLKDKWRVLNKEGKRLGRMDFDNLSEVYAGLMYDKKDGQEAYAVVDKNGMRITDYTITKPITFGSSYYAAAAKEDGYAFVNKMGNFQKDKYETIVSNKSNTIFACKKDGMIQILNEKLEKTNEFQADFDLVGFLGDLICFRDNMVIGLITKDAGIVQQPKYAEIGYDLIDGYGTMISTTGESVLIDDKGNEVFSIGNGCYFVPFEKCDSEIQKVVYVKQNDSGAMGLINIQDGSFIIDCMYGEVRYLGHKLFAVKDGDNYGIRSVDGGEVLPVTDGIKNIVRLDDARLALNQNGTWYIYDFNLNVVSEEGLEYENIHTFSDGYAIVEKRVGEEMRFGLIDQNLRLAFGNFAETVEEPVVEVQNQVQVTENTVNQ